MKYYIATAYVENADQILKRRVVRCRAHDERDFISMAALEINCPTNAGVTFGPIGLSKNQRTPDLFIN